jgi:hypothetical protein
LATELDDNAKPQEFPEGFASLQVVALALGMKECDYVGDDRGVAVALRIVWDGGPRGWLRLRGHLGVSSE